MFEDRLCSPLNSEKSPGDGEHLLKVVTKVIDLSYEAVIIAVDGVRFWIAGE